MTVCGLGQTLRGDANGCGSESNEAPSVLPGDRKQRKIRGSMSDSGSTRASFGRGILGLLMAAVTGRSAEIFGQRNGPKCAVCSTPYEVDVPEYSLVVANPDQTLASLPGTRLLVCQKCGVMSIASV